MITTVTASATLDDNLSFTERWLRINRED